MTGSATPGAWREAGWRGSERGEAAGYGSGACRVAGLAARVMRYTPLQPKFLSIHSYHLLHLTLILIILNGQLRPFRKPCWPHGCLEPDSRYSRQDSPSALCISSEATMEIVKLSHLD